jgi:hypothetical protein
MEDFTFEEQKSAVLKNPFENAEKEDLIETYQFMDKLYEFHKKFVTRVMMGKRENIIQEIQTGDNIREIEYHDYGKGGSKYIRDSVKLSDGKERVLAYQFDCPKNLGDYVGRASLIGRNLSHETIKSFQCTVGAHGIEFYRGINGQRPTKMDEQGLHYSSREQAEWSRSWYEFFRFLDNDKVFSDALDRVRFSINNRRLISLNPLEVNIEQVMGDLEMIWNAAYSTKLLKKKFPKERAPNSFEPPNVDSVISHQDLQRMLSSALNRLVEDVAILDEVDEPKDPYR